MEIFSKTLTVSKNHRWYQKTCEFDHVHTKVRRSDSLYEAKVDVYEDRVQTRFLDWAANLVNQENFAGDYVALCVALAYIEGVEQYRRGTDRPPEGMVGKWLQDSATRILPGAPQPAIDRLMMEAFPVLAQKPGTKPNDT